MKKQHNYFKDLLTLGVYTYDDLELKRSYRKLARQTHPDAPSGDELKFKYLKDAYDNLKGISDEDKRVYSGLNKAQFAHGVLGVKVMIDKKWVDEENNRLLKEPLSESSLELLSACYNYIVLKASQQEVTYILADNIYKGINI